MDIAIFKKLYCRKIFNKSMIKVIIKAIFVIIFVVLVCIYSHIYIRQNGEDSNSYNGSQYDETFHHSYRIIDDKKAVNKSEMKYILLWNVFGRNLQIGLGSKIFERCPIKTCYITNSRKFMPEEDFDAIICNSGSCTSGTSWYAKKVEPPDQKKRKAKQKYISLSSESPMNTYFEDKCLRNYFNWTMTYRRDSDIHYPYGMFFLKDTKYKIPTLEEFKSKKRTASWMVSNCIIPGTEIRIAYFNELKKYIDIDVYGACGNLSCGYSQECRKEFAKHYFFYLSFENSLGRDYVTEKLFNTLEYNIIPVALGSANYDDITPKYSVIDTKHFATPKLLADYLLQLKNNYTEYVKYFEWKKKYTLVTDIWNLNYYARCQLCEMLHRPLEYSSYENLKEWYFEGT